MKSKLISLVFSLIFFLVLVGCGEGSRVSSEDVPTSNIYAAMDISSDSSGSIFVSAQLRNGGGSSNVYLEVRGDDRLIASLDEPYSQLDVSSDLFSSVEALSKEHKSMDKVSQYWVDVLGLDIIELPAHWYKAEFTDAVNQNERVYVSLYRDDHTDAEDSYVDLPAPYNITAPVASNGALYSRSTDDIVLQWDSSGTNAAVVIDVIASCENGDSDDWQLNVTDTGTATIPSGTLSSLAGLCSYVIRMKKITLGVFDAKFGAGGIIRGAQIRSVSVNTTD